MNIPGNNQFWKAIKPICRSSKYDKITLSNLNNPSLAENSA